MDFHFWERLGREESTVLATQHHLWLCAIVQKLHKGKSDRSFVSLLRYKFAHDQLCFRVVTCARKLYSFKPIFYDSPRKCCLSFWERENSHQRVSDFFEEFEIKNKIAEGCFYQMRTFCGVTLCMTLLKSCKKCHSTEMRTYYKCLTTFH